MEREIVTAGRKLADYLKGEGISKLGRKELRLLASVSTDLLPGDHLEMVRKMIFVGTRSGVYESLVLGSDPINLLVASAMDRLTNREMIAESFAKRVIALILVVMHPFDEEVAKIERFVDGVPITPPTPQPTPPTPKPKTPPTPPVPPRVKNIPTPPIQPTIQQRMQNIPTPRPKKTNNNIVVTNNTTVTNNTVVTTNNSTITITGGGGNISVNTNNNNTTVKVGGNITVGGNVTVTSNPTVTVTSNPTVTLGVGKQTIVVGGGDLVPQKFDIQGDVLVKYHGTDSDVVIPKGVKVIGKYAFASNNYIRSVKIPSGVTEISAYAFSNCKHLKEVVIPSTLGVVGEYAFANCSSLGLFAQNLGCGGLMKIDGNLHTIRSYAFVGCIKLLHLAIAQGAKNIHSYAFSGCTGINRIEINSFSVRIDDYAFNGCSKAIVEPRNLTNRGPNWSAGVKYVSYVF